jgi:hypothetical protein
MGRLALSVPITAEGGEDGLARLGSYCLNCLASSVGSYYCDEYIRVGTIKDIYLQLG